MEISGRLIQFVHYLRAAEFDVSTYDALQMGRALELLEQPNPELTRLAFRALCCRSQPDWVEFDRKFRHFWLGIGGQIEETAQIFPDMNPEKDPLRLIGLGGTTEQPSDLYDPGKGGAAGAGQQDSLSKADFRFLRDQAVMKRIERLAEQLAGQIRPRPGRRRRLSLKGNHLALAKTLQSSIRTGGVPLCPWFFKQRPELPKLVILHDVSHSMTFNNPLLIRFSRGLVRKLDHAEVFVFHTRLVPATGIFREPTLQRMRSQLELSNKLWLGGTCIADSLLEFREKHAKRMLSPRSVVIVISDGFDSNEPGQLIGELKRLKRLCSKVIWMNPMLEREGFNANKEAVLNLRKQVDHLLPAHSLDALRRSIIAIRA